MNKIPQKLICDLMDLLAEFQMVLISQIHVITGLWHLIASDPASRATRRWKIKIEVIRLKIVNLHRSIGDALTKIGLEVIYAGAPVPVLQEQ